MAVPCTLITSCAAGFPGEELVKRESARAPAGLPAPRRPFPGSGPAHGDRCSPLSQEPLNMCRVQLLSASNEIPHVALPGLDYSG